MVSAVISSCFRDTTCSAPASGFSDPKASECISTRSTPGGSTRRARICSTVSCRISSSEALQLKNCTSRPSARIFSWISATCGSLSRRSRWTPKMFMPVRASSSAVASPNPLLAPRIKAQGCLLMWVCSNSFARVVGSSGLCKKPSDFDFPFVVAGRADANLGALRGQDLREPLTPLDQHQGVAVKELVEPQGGYLPKLVQAVQIDMIYPAVSEFVDESEGGTGYFVMRGRAEAVYDALRQRSLSRPQVTDQQDYSARREFLRELLSQRDGLRLRGGAVELPRHRRESESPASGRGRRNRLPHR